MAADEQRLKLKLGIAEAEKRHFVMALVHLEEAARLETTPLLKSYLGYCIALERRQLKHGVALCNDALRQEPAESIHYYNLARIYLAFRQKSPAIKTLHRGLKYGNDRRLSDMLKKLGLRKPPPFPTLDRGHILNRVVGKLLHSIGMR